MEGTAFLQLLHLSAMSLWASQFTLLSLSFLICKMGKNSTYGFCADLIKSLHSVLCHF